MKKVIGWLAAAFLFVPVFPVIVVVGFAKKLQTGEVTMQELVAKYYIDVVLVVGVIAVCAIICRYLEKWYKAKRPASNNRSFNDQVVHLTYKNDREKEILEGMENSGLVELGDRISRARLELPGPQETPWAVFEGTRAFLSHIKDRRKS